jgi:phosphate transport system protein
VERHFERDLEELKERLLHMGGLVEQAVHQAVQSVLESQPALAEQVLAREPTVNELQIEIDERVLHLLALQQLMAVDLRFALAVTRINSDLERIGDQAVNIAESALRIIRHPRVKPYVDLPLMSDLAEGMLRDSLNALVRKDVDLARSVLVRDDQVDNLRNQMFRELLSYMMENSAVVFTAFELILVAKNLERIGDHATNIAEDVIYMVMGRDVRHHALDRR